MMLALRLLQTLGLPGVVLGVGFAAGLLAGSGVVAWVVEVIG